MRDMLEGYHQGRFLMAETAQDDALHWCQPSQRGVMPLNEGFHLPRRLRRTVLAGRYDVTSDRDFTRILNLCAAQHPTRIETWINQPLKNLYEELHKAGYAHSVEVWEGDKLLGGLFGIHIGGAFFGETMVSRARDVSKIALIHLVATLRRQGFALLDTQYSTSHLAQFGCLIWDASFYRKALSTALKRNVTWSDDVRLDTLMPEIQSLRVRKAA